MLRCILIASFALTARGDTTCSGDGCRSEELGLLQRGAVAQPRKISAQRVAANTAPCAGKDIRVVTDMGFDDWGAFAVLQAAGCMPTHALLTQGMMLPSAFAEDFSRLLQSWSFTTELHTGSEDCYNATVPTATATCINTSFIETSWGYRSKIMAYYNANATGPNFSPTAPANLSPAEDFWLCANGQQFTLLAISPLSDVAMKLSVDAVARNCIEEIVMMGGFFATSNQGKEVLAGQDMTTQMNLMDGTGESDWPNVIGNTELNVASDVKAAQWVLDSKLPVREMPLEVASIDRIGKQLLTDGYNDVLQVSRTTSEVAKLCNTANVSFPASTMLEQMACIHKAGGDVATLDMDAMAVTYAWTGDKHFEFTRGRVTVGDAAKTEIDTFFNFVDWKCHKSVASQFDAVGWFEDLSELIPA